MNWAHYLLQVNIYLIIFYGFYRLLLAKETYFMLNRFYLVISGFLSLIIPFLRFDWIAKQEVAKQVSIGVGHFQVLWQDQTLPNPASPAFSWGNVIVVLYIAGMVYFGGRFFYQLYLVRRVFLLAPSGSAFSFFGSKVVSPDVPEPAIVHQHEDTHIRQKHSLDVLFFELIGILTWLNPVVYAYKNAIKNIHEFLADREAAALHGDREAYSLLLLSQAIGASPSDLAHGFFHKSLLKKRIHMLHKERSAKTAMFKYGLFVPLFALALILSSATMRDNNRLLAVTAQLPAIKEAVSAVMEQPMRIVEVEIAPEIRFPLPRKTLGNPEKGADLNALKEYASRPIFTRNADAPAQVKSSVHLFIKEGKIEKLNIHTAAPQPLNEAIIDHLSRLPNALTITDGEYYFQPTIRFVKEDKGNGMSPAYEEVEAPLNFTSVAVPPSYPGGMSKFYDFLSKNIRYPEMAFSSGAEGVAYMSFTIEKDGSITHITSLRKLGYGLDEEAIRVLSLSKPWLPAQNDGKSVRVKYHIPIKFMLQGSQKSAEEEKTSFSFQQEQQTEELSKVSLSTVFHQPASHPLYPLQLESSGGAISRKKEKQSVWLSVQNPKVQIGN